jgi:hypothetical protein
MIRYRATVACAALLALTRGATAQIAVSSPTVVENQVVPGESYRGAIRIRNSSPSETRRALIYQTDYLFAANGSNNYAQPGTLARSNATWLTIDVPEVELPPGGDAVVEYTVRVPRDSAALIGSYWSMVMIEDRPSLRSAAPPARSVAVTTIMRYAVQVASHIAGTGAPRLTFSAPKMEDGMVSVDITNAGTLACRPALRLEVYGADGTVVATQSAQRGLLYPETSLRQAFALKQLAPGTYTALLVADVGGSELFGIRYQIVR